MIGPHGGNLVNRIATEEHAEQLEAEMSDQPTIQLTHSQFQDMINIITGRFSPLKGFMSQSDFLKVTHDMTLEDGTAWSLPVTLDIDATRAERLVPGERVGLEAPDESLIGLIEVTDVYKYNKQEAARCIYKTTDTNHPGVAKLYHAGEFLVGGDILSFNKNRYNEFDLFPAETRVLIGQNDWETVVGFQTRNAPHRAHEYIQKSALEHTDGLLVQPKLGYKKKRDYTDGAIMGAYKELIKYYYDSAMVALSVFPSQMRYAGPREAVFDAIVRKNQGCTHFVVGRDHAGVGDYYDGFEAHDIFDDVQDLGIKPLFYTHSFYCKRCDGMSSKKLCPHERSVQTHPSGTQIREMLADNVQPPSKMMRPEVSSYLMETEPLFIDTDHTHVVHQ